MSRTEDTRTRQDAISEGDFRGSQTLRSTDGQLFVSTRHSNQNCLSTLIRMIINPTTNIEQLRNAFYVKYNRLHATSARVNVTLEKAAYGSCSTEST